MTVEKRTASSCAVEKIPGGIIRLSLIFMHLGEYNDAEQAVLAHINAAQELHNDSSLQIDTSDARKGGTSKGSKLVVLLDPKTRVEAFRAAVEVFDAFDIRRGIEYVNGSRQPQKSVAAAVKVALY